VSSKLGFVRERVRRRSSLIEANVGAISRVWMAEQVAVQFANTPSVLKASDRILLVSSRPFAQKRRAVLPGAPHRNHTSGTRHPAGSIRDVRSADRRESVRGGET
jgi:hypothetical protein